jgi:hypothetical protein
MINLIIKVNTVDVTDQVQAQSLQITDNINQRRDTCSFVVKKTPTKTLVPEIGDEVEVFDDVTPIFGGVIVSVDQSIEVADLIEYKVMCTDYSQFLDRRLVLERFENETVGDIIDYLLTTYATGFTANNVVGDFEIKSIAFNRIPISDCIQKIADLTGFSWYVGYDKDIHFFPKNEEMAPYQITDDSENFIWSSLNFRRDLSQLRNRIIIEGGEEVGNTRTEEFTTPNGNEEERATYRLANKFAKKPDVITYVGMTPTIRTVGIDYLDDDASFDCMWNFNEKYIRFTAGNIPSNNDIVEVTGDPLFPVIVQVQSSISIGQYGVYEFVIRDKTIRSRDEARERALTELTAYQNGIVEGGLRTYTPGLRSGQTIVVGSVIRDILESFLIQSVVFRMRTPEEGEWTVKLATLRTIGIIDFLRALLRRDDVKENENETLLTLLQFTDEATAGDVLTFPAEITSPPYIWLSDDPGEDATTIANAGGLPPIKWNYWTWDA